MEFQRSKAIMERTIRIYYVVIVLIFIALFMRIAWLQVIKTGFYKTRAVSNTMRLIPETASRGEIKDKNGQVLVSNRPVFNLSLDYLGLNDEEGSDEIIKKLVAILEDPEITFADIKKAIKTQRNRLFEPIIIKRDISIELVTTIEEHRRDLPGVSIMVQPQRSYNYGNLAGHLLGYVHSIKKELDQPGYEDYGLGDLVGKTGIEKTYEHELRGENGFRQVEVTAKNRPVREIREIPSVPGNNVELTIDLKLQQVMEQSFDETLAIVQKKHPKAQAGAAVLLDVNSGKVLAMASRPILDPDDFNGKSLKQEKVDYYFRNFPPALRNRAIQGNYVPGSTFKPITGMAALEAGVGISETVTCSGRYWKPPFIKCTGVHGKVNYYSAMAKSCNVYFQEMARRAGMGLIGTVGREFGLGERTGIDLPFESSGLLPNLEWQKNEFDLRAIKINERFDKQKDTLETGYQKKITNEESEQEKRRLQRELANKKRLLEQQRKIELDYYTQWHDFDTYNSGIGQGYNQYTVIQLANYTATLANGGKRYKPFTVQKIIASDGTLIHDTKPELLGTVSVSPETIAETQKAMTAGTAPGGTSYYLFYKFPEDIKVAAKTGTAQPGRAGYVKNKDFDGLFIAFAPADNPQIAFAGVIEHGWSGSGSIGHVAKAVFEEYFGLTKEETSSKYEQPASPD